MNIRAIRLSWLVWEKRYDECSAACKSAAASQPLLQILSDWATQQVLWMSNLPPEEQDDLIDLACAEIEMLWTVIDPAAHAPSGYFPGSADEARYGTEFRTRFHVVQLLPILLMRAGVPRHGVLDDAIRRLSDFAEKKGWLP